MKCGRAKELILTGYTDGEIDERLAARVEEHMASCDACRRLSRSLSIGVVGPIRSGGKMKAPEGLWERVRERLEDGYNQPAANERWSFFSGLRNMFRSRLPALAAASALTVALVVGSFAVSSVYRNTRVDRYLDEQFDFLSSLGTGPENGVFGDIGIPMEDIS